MDITIREYAEKDYARCEDLVNRAWRFDAVFQPQKLAAIAKRIYTQGSVIESTYRTVAETQGEVVGFIFGMNEFAYQPRLHLGLKLRILWALLTLRSSTPDKRTLLRAMAEHEKNRSNIISKHRSEIVLFVVSEAYQGKGIGKALWLGFLDNCINSGISSIVVETNHQGGSGFYERIGFQHLADFDSPLHNLVTPTGQACVYQYACQQKSDNQTASL